MDGTAIDLGAPRVFLSYAHADQPSVEPLYQELARAGMEPWMDVHDLEPGSIFKKEIVRNIRDAPSLSPAFRISPSADVG
jgi:TIR domain